MQLCSQKDTVFVKYVHCSHCEHATGNEILMVTHICICRISSMYVNIKIDVAGDTCTCNYLNINSHKILLNVWGYSCQVLSIYIKFLMDFYCDTKFI